MAFKDGDFLEVEYNAYDAADNKLLSTTEEKKAKEGNIYDSRMAYGPALVILGRQGVIKGLDRELRNMKENEQKRFTFKPEDAFGEHSEELVRVMPLSTFREHDMDPKPGMSVNLDDVVAIVKSVSSGRVVVDANHPYAGKDIIYEIRILRQLTSEKDKINALGSSYGAVPTSLTASADKVELVYDNAVGKNADYFVGRANLIAAIFSNLKDVKKIEIKEEYLRPEEKKDNK